MWQVFEHRKLDRKLGRLPVEVLKRYEKWQDIVRISGPSGLKAIRGFNDESLQGQWKGCRSSRLSQKYRIIYRVEADLISVLVLELTAHDYRRK